MGLLLAAAVVLVAVKAGPPKTAAVADAGAADATPDGATSSAASTGATSTANADSDAGAPDPDAGAEDPGASDAGATLLDGEAPPSLAGDAPKTVTFGVILVTYKGAQGAPPNARSRDEALTIAKQLAEKAKTDFKAAVADGDKGSMENAGRMPRGMLEPAPEGVLFNLAKGAVSDPVETPRGFWIMQRIE
ncbi:MAG: peptidylprolyl isomerase [Polyangiaceae bacterium]